MDLKRRRKHIEGTQSYELLVVVANQGYTEYIMEAARSERGGRNGHSCKGNRHAESGAVPRLFPCKPKKEMILIVVKNCDKNAIMKAIMEKAGLESKGKVDRLFASVTETAGMRLVEDE